MSHHRGELGSYLKAVPYLSSVGEVTINLSIGIQQTNIEKPLAEDIRKAAVHLACLFGAQIEEAIAVHSIPQG